MNNIVVLFKRAWKNSTTFTGTTNFKSAILNVKLNTIKLS